MGDHTNQEICDITNHVKDDTSTKTDEANRPASPTGVTLWEPNAHAMMKRLELFEKRYNLGRTKADAEARIDEVNRNNKALRYKIEDRVKELTNLHKGLMDEIYDLNKYFIHPALAAIQTETHGLKQSLDKLMEKFPDQDISRSLAEMDKVLAEEVRRAYTAYENTATIPWNQAEEREDGRSLYRMLQENIGQRLQSISTEKAKDEAEKWAMENQRLAGKKFQRDYKEEYGIYAQMYRAGMPSRFYALWELAIWHLNTCAAVNVARFQRLKMEPTPLVSDTNRREAFLLIQAMSKIFMMFHMINDHEVHHFEMFKKVLTHHVLKGVINIENVFKFITHMVYIRCCRNPHIPDPADEVPQWSKFIGVIALTFRHDKPKGYLDQHLDALRESQKAELLTWLNNLYDLQCKCEWHRNYPIPGHWASWQEPCPRYELVKALVEPLKPTPTTEQINIEYVNTILLKIMYKVHGLIMPSTPYTFADQCRKCESHDGKFSDQEMEELRKIILETQGWATTDDISYKADRLQTQKHAACPCPTHALIRETYELLPCTNRHTDMLTASISPLLRDFHIYNLNQGQEIHGFPPLSADDVRGDQQADPGELPYSPPEPTESQQALLDCLAELEYVFEINRIPEPNVEEKAETEENVDNESIEQNLPLNKEDGEQPSPFGNFTTTIDGTRCKILNPKDGTLVFEVFLADTTDDDVAAMQVATLVDLLSTTWAREWQPVLNAARDDMDGNPEDHTEQNNLDPEAEAFDPPCMTPDSDDSSVQSDTCYYGHCTLKMHQYLKSQAPQIEDDDDDNIEEYFTSKEDEEAEYTPMETPGQEDAFRHKLSLSNAFRRFDVLVAHKSHKIELVKKLLRCDPDLPGPLADPSDPDMRSGYFASLGYTPMMKVLNNEEAPPVAEDSDDEVPELEERGLNEID